MSDERSSHDVTTDVHDEVARLAMEQRLSQLEERLRTQKDEYEEKLRVQKDESEEKLRTQKDEYEENVRVQREGSEERVRVLEETVNTLRAGMDMYGPFPFDDLPLELIALVSDFVGNVDDLASMSLVSHCVRNGVLLSQPWIVVEEIVAATEGDVEEQRRILHNRQKCAQYACKKGLLRAIRALNLSRSEFTEDASTLVQVTCDHRHLEVVKYFKSMYALTAVELNGEPTYGTMHYAVVMGHLDVVRYLHSVCGVTVSRSKLATACYHGQLETLKYLHTEVGFTREDVRLLYHNPLFNAAIKRRRDCLAYLRTEFGVTKEDARQVIDELDLEAATLVREVFELT